MRTALSLLTLALVAGCGTQATSADEQPTATPSAPPGGRPTAVPAPAGEVTTGGPVTVLDDGDGAELCLGGVLTSLPPQCGGPPLVGWDWAEHDGWEQVGDVTWGEYAVTGTFDGRRFTVTSVVPADEWVPPADHPTDERDLSTPCPEPVGGWSPVDPARTTRATLDRALATARRLPGYADSWVDQSINPHDPASEPEAMNDPRLLVVNLRVTGDADAAEARLREVWGGALCVTGGMPRTDRELRAIQQELLDLPGTLGGGRDGDGVTLDVVVDDGSIQAWVDGRYGVGAVHVTSALQPAG